MNEEDYTQGHRAAYLGMLRECLRQLGIDDAEAGKVKWVVERELTVSMLRQVCGQHGDNDWPDNLNLADVIEKHLWRNLGQ